FVDCPRGHGFRGLDRLQRVRDQGLSGPGGRVAKILVVDDDLASNVVMSKALTNDGHIARTAFNGEEGVRRFSAERCELLITDLQMPKLDGVGMIGRLQSLGLLEGVPVILVSTKDERDVIRIAHELGAADVIVKPIEATALQFRVRRVLERKRSNSSGPK